MRRAQRVKSVGMRCVDRVVELMKLAPMRISARMRFVASAAVKTMPVRTARFALKHAVRRVVEIMNLAA